MGKNTTKIKEYIANQLKEDKLTEQMTITELLDKIKEYIANQLKEDKLTEQMTITELLDPFKQQSWRIAKGGLWVSDFAKLASEGYALKLKTTS